MKRVLSISLGAPHRDHSAELVLAGSHLHIERRGTNGDIDRAVELYRANDGSVDAFGVGGIEFFLQVGDRRYYWRDAKRIRAAVSKSKIGDGNGVRAVLSRRAVRALEQHLAGEERSLAGMRVLKTTATARYFLAADLAAAGCHMVFGDFMFGLNLPIPVRDLRTVRRLGATLLPAVTQLPYRWLYDIGDDQSAPPKPRWQRHFDRADIIAGDFLQIRSCMPDDLSGKIIVTNTTTRRDVEELRLRRAHLLVTESPRIEGRTFGSNVIEAILLALIEKPQDQVTTADFERLIDAVDLRPGIEVLTPRH